MKKHASNLLTYELVWWLATAIVCGMVYLRVSTAFPTYPFLFENMVFIVVFITLTRWIFLLPLSLISLSRNLMIVAIFAAIPLFLYILGVHRSFKTNWDDGTLIQYVAKGDYDELKGIANFFKSEMIFFSVGSLVALFVFPFRMVKGVWQKYNRGYV